MATVIPQTIPFTISLDGGSDMGTFVHNDSNGGNVTSITGVTWGTAGAAAQNGDLAIIPWVFLNTETPTDPTSETWTLVLDNVAGATDCRGRILYRICDGTESGDITGWSTTGAGNRQAAVLYVVRGYDFISGFSVFDETTNSTSHDCPTLTTADGFGGNTPANGDTILVFAFDRAGSTAAIAPPSGWTTRSVSVFAATGTGGTVVGMADDSLTDAATFPVNPATWTGFVSSDDAFTVTMSLRPTAGGTTFTQNLAGAVTPAGAQVRQTGKSTAGAIAPAGAPIKQTNKALPGTVTPAGSLLKATIRRFAGSVTPAGTVVNALVRLLNLAGTITPTGALLKQVNRILSGAVAPTGAVTKQARKPLGGAITPSGAVASIKSILLALAGAITPAGSVIRQTRRTLAGTSTPAGSLLKQTAKRFPGGITPTGAAATTRLVLLAIAGAIASSGALTKRVSKTLTGTLDPTGTLLKLISRVFGGAITPTGASTHSLDIPQFNGSSTPTLTGLSSAATVTGLTQSAPAALVPEIIPFTIASGSATVTPAGRSTATVSDG